MNGRNFIGGAVACAAAGLWIGGVLAEGGVRAGDFGVPQVIVTEACGAVRANIAGIPGEETYRAYEPSNGWTRVDYVLRPTTNSYIRCRLILPPKERWTGRFWGLGNSSEGGNVWHDPSYAKKGDASVHCDLGTSAGRHYRFPEVFDDYGWRATHLMTVTGKALTEAFYGRKISRSYYHGASTGGNQGMREAMDFPEDYDGIAVEVPAFPRVPMCALYWWIERAVRDESGKRIVTESQCKAMAEAALEWFSDKDEPYARGRFLTNPRYTPEAERGIYALAEKRCAELKSAGVRARWHAIFTGPVINGRRAHAGYSFGADLTMLAKRYNYNLAWFVGKKFDVFKVPPETIEAYARRFAPQVNAEKEDLSAFAAHGGKLLVMPGIEDEYIPVSSAIDWYERVADRMGGFDRTKTFCRMFLLPGRAHAKGRGIWQPKNVEGKLVDWVERGVAPERLDSGDYPIAAYPDKIGGSKELGWTVKPYDRSNLPRVDPLYLHGRKALSTGVEIPAGGVPTWDGRMQYTTRTEKRPDVAALLGGPDTKSAENRYLKWKWRMNLADPKTGLDNAGLIAGMKKIVAESGWKAGKEDWYDVSARMFDFLADNVQIGFSKYDCFPAISAWDRHARPSGAVLWPHAAEVDRKYSPNLRAEIEKMRREGRASIGKDFDHSAPDWDDIFKIGFPGMKARVDAIQKNTPFYRAEKRTAAALMRFLDRLLATAKAHPDADSPLMKLEIASLERLRKGPPETCFDLMEFTMVYFILSEPLNYFQVRTMGNIDRLWLPYYERDLKTGRTTEMDFREQFRHFIWQFGSIDNYWGHPIYLGGVNLDGRAAYNSLSSIILDVVDKEALPTPKFQLKIGPDTPDAIWNQSLDMLRRHRSLVLMSEPNMMESMKAVGLPEADAKDLLIWGCFEYLPRARGNCTSATFFNMPQPVVEILVREKVKVKGEGEQRRGECPLSTSTSNLDLPTFAAFKAEYLRILTNNAARTVALANENERHLAECNPALILSLAVPSALERGVDAFSLGYDYNYTAISMNGFGTAIDSLLAVKEFVYDRKEVSLAEFAQAIASDWKGYETLQLKAKRSKFKWGCGNPEADALAKEVVETFTGSFVGKPNARGGKYVCYGLTSRGFVNGAAQLNAATPDGRNKADHFSKNIAPSTGAETEGVSGSIRSMGALGPRNFPCGSIYDVVIHPSMVSGEKGLFAFRKIVERYFAEGGVAMNINIVSPELLRDAQAHPEKYENLQVRVAGWNIRWNDIPKKEQDEYILRAECIAR